MMSEDVRAPAQLPQPSPRKASLARSRSTSLGSSPRCASPDAADRHPRQSSPATEDEAMASWGNGKVDAGARDAAAAQQQEAQEERPQQQQQQQQQQQRAVIPGPTLPPPGLARQRSGSSGSLRSMGSASPPPPPMRHPVVMPAYGWGSTPFPVYHVYPPPPGSAEEHHQRCASPPAVFPAGGSPPLPTGFISVPLHAMSSEPGSPTSHHMYGGSPPPYGSSPPPYGSSPLVMSGSPPAVMYMPPPPYHHHHHHHPPEYGMGHAGYAVAQPDYVQHMAGITLSQPQPVPQPPRPGSTGSGSGGARSEGRASARIARSHRAGGAYDPAEFAFDLEEADSGRPDARTTVMIRHIPNKYSAQDMLSVLDKSGFSNTFDFFYLPVDFRNRCNLGYAFVNFLDARSAGRLYRQYHNKRWEEHNSRKTCEVTYGRVQGREALVQHFRSSKFPSDDAEFMPLVYTRVEGGRASRPLPIHAYIASTEGGDAEAGAPAAEGAPAEPARQADA